MRGPCRLVPVSEETGDRPGDFATVMHMVKSGLVWTWQAVEVNRVVWFMVTDSG